MKHDLCVFCRLPIALPYLFPAGGSTASGMSLPGGTVVGCQPYTLHLLDMQVSSDPDMFTSEGWPAPERATRWMQAVIDPQHRATQQRLQVEE